MKVVKAFASINIYLLPQNAFSTWKTLSIINKFPQIDAENEC